MYIITNIVFFFFLQFTVSDNCRFESGLVVVAAVRRRVMCYRNNSQWRILRRTTMLLLLLTCRRRWPGRALIRWTETNCRGCRGTSRSSGRSTTGVARRTSRACTRTMTDDTCLLDKTIYNISTSRFK